MDIELMEKKLYDACLKGDVQMLEALMREDELTLARISLSSCINQTPLHLACMLGHFEFAKSLLSYKPDFVRRLDSQGRSPLHLASANGYADIVGLLLRHDQKMCRVRDEDGRTPLHLAVMNGQHESVSELIKVNCDYGEQGTTVLHLCVMYNRLNILILLLESNVQDWSNIEDDTGNTILHFATGLKRMQIIKYLLKSISQVVDVNAVNKNGLTALDIIEQMPKDVKTMEIKELLISAGTIRAEEPESATMNSLLIPGVDRVAAKENNSKQGGMLKNSKNIGNFPKKEKKKEKNLLLAATVIAAMAYQAALSPPGGIASLDATPNHLDPDSSYDLKPATSLLAYFYKDINDLFWVSNTMAFVAALSVIFLYVSGASPKRRFFVWFVRLDMSITLTSMIAAYVFAVLAITRRSHDLTEELKSHSATVEVLIIGLCGWVALLCLAILVLVIRLLIYIVRTMFRFLSYIVRIIVKTIKRAFRKKNTSQDAAATFRRTPNANIV